MDVICEACGELNRSAGEFCTSCGSFLAWEGSAQTTPPTEAPQAGPPAAAAADDQATAAPIRAQPAPARPTTAAAVVAPEPTGPRCSQCGLGNDPNRRFCAHCGEQVAGLRPDVVRPEPDRTAIRSRERASRRAYAAILPPLYRWGRPVLAIVLIVLVVALAIAAGTDPIGWGQARWHDLRGTVVATPGVQATLVGGAAEPEQTAPGDPAALVDGSAAEWSTPWTSSEPAETCGGADGSPAVELTLAQPTRIRAIDVRAGLGAAESDRPLQFRPRVIGIVVEDGACRAYPLADTAEPQRLDVDTGDPVSVIRIGVDSAYPARDDGQQRLSITEITLLSRPQ